jgi:hypothetical protein
MSPYFISIFNRATKCPHCHASKKEGYSVCSKHLEKAKQHWRKWQVVRRAERKCCYCHKKSFKGFLRCKEHTIVNRVKCKAGERLTLTTAKKPGFAGRPCLRPREFAKFVPVTARSKKALLSAGPVGSGKFYSTEK